MESLEPITLLAFECLRGFLEASADPHGGFRLLACLEPDVLVPWLGEMMPQSRLKAPAYTASRAESADGRPVFADARPLAWRADGTTAIMRAIAREVTDDREVELAAGFKHGRLGWRLSWVTLAPDPWTWDASLAYVAALSEFAAGPAHEAEHWLERAYMHRYRREEPTMLVEENARFECHGSTRCCRNAMKIILPAGAQAFVDALPLERIAPELVGTQLDRQPDGQLMLKGAYQACRFLDEHGRCRIHSLLGRPVFGPCTTFPFQFARTPDGVVATATQGCDSVRGRRGPLVATRIADLHERLYLANRVDGADTFRITEDREVPWSEFRDAEARVIEALRGSGSIRERIVAAAAAIEGPIDTSAYMDPEARETVRAMISAITEGVAPFEAMAGGLRHDGLREPEVLANVLETMIFSKKAAFAHDLLTAVNLAALLYLMTLAMQAAQPPDRLDADFWELVALLPTNGPGFIALPTRESGAPLTGAAMRRAGYAAWLMTFAG